MALGSILVTFVLFAMALSPSRAFSAPQFVNGKVSCSGCSNDYDFSGIKITVSCENTRKRLVATTNKKGDFTAELPSKVPLDCVAEIGGGPTQLYATRMSIRSKIVVVKPYGRNVLSSPLIFSTSRPSNSLGSSKTVDFPVPREWGLAPTSYYFPPFFPIIGIP